jgi:general L-amino acid transport system permease protein
MAETRPLPSTVGPGLDAPRPGEAQRRPDNRRALRLGAIGRALFGSRLNAAITLVCLAFALWALPRFLRWALFDAVFTGDSAACRAAPNGACWAFVHEKLRFMLFGLYPAAEHWRPLAMCLVFIAMIIGTCFAPRRELLGAWSAALILIFVLLSGDPGGGATLALILGAAALEAHGAWSKGKKRACGIALVAGSCAGFVLIFAGNSYLVLALFALLALSGAGRAAFMRERVLLWCLTLACVAFLTLLGPFLPYHPTTQWSGLPLTLVLSLTGLVLAFPLAILLALARRSRLALPRMLSIAYIEAIRGVPLVTLLFMAAFLLPLLLPNGAILDKVVRVDLVLVMFVAAYLAEILRGGLQAIPLGQYEAAQSLGLPYWRMMRLIVLPQVIRIAIPSIVTLAISFFKDTSLVLIIGLFDFLQDVRSSMSDPNWLGYSTEGYLFAALVYFVFCFGVSRYSLRLERDLDPAQRGEDKQMREFLPKRLRVSP